MSSAFLQLCTTIACTLCTTAVFVYGVAHLIDDHNKLQLKRSFRQKQKRTRNELRQIEEECTFSVASMIADLRAETTLLEVTLQPTKSKAKTAKNIILLEEQLLRLLERLDSIQPCQWIGEECGIYGNTIQAISNPFTATSGQNTPDSSSYGSETAKTDTNVFKVEEYLSRIYQFDLATQQLMIAGVETLKSKKKSLTRKVQEYLEQVDKLSDTLKQFEKKMIRSDSKLDPELLQI